MVNTQSPMDAHSTSPEKNVAGNTSPELANTYAGAGSLKVIQAINGTAQSSDISQFGFDPDPFSAKYENPNEGMFAKAWDGVRGLVGAQPTLADKLRSQAYEKLTPAERKQYDAEDGAMVGYEGQMTLNPGKAPDMPMHDQVSKAAAAQARQIEQQVLNSMTPEQRQQLIKEEQDYDHACRVAISSQSPYADTIAMPKLPDKGPTMKYFESQVQQLAQQEVAHPPGH